MQLKHAHSDFASPLRASSEQIIHQHHTLVQNHTFQTMANSFPLIMVALNEQRQIVFANTSFIKVHSADSDNYLGKRVGEAVNCIHSNQKAGGCGTTEFCSKCGAVNAILDAQGGKAAENECRIVTTEHDALDFRVNATSYQLNNHSFVLFYVRDIRNEKRREVLERVFFHDLMNSAGGVAGLSSVLCELKDMKQIEDISNMINNAAQQLILDISEQKQLLSAENDQLDLRVTDIESVMILHQIKNLYSKHEISDKKEICIDENAESVILYTDPVLLKRVLGNMVKNALEASPIGNVVRLSVVNHKKQVLFSVHNDSYIDRDTQLQLFKRSFTTKGAGRGLGTYSIKLFGEKYLKGKVWFKSTQQRGTTFFIELPVNPE